MELQDLNAALELQIQVRKGAIATREDELVARDAELKILEQELSWTKFAHDLERGHLEMLDRKVVAAQHSYAQRMENANTSMGGQGKEGPGGC